MERWSEKSSTFWIIASTTLSAIIVTIVIESLRGKRIERENRTGEWRDLKDNLRHFQAKATGGLKDNPRHFRAERSGGGEVVECERDSGRHRLLWIIVSVSLFITIIESDNRAGEWRDLKDTHRHVRAKWSGGGEAVECGRWSEKSSLFWIIVSVSLFITTIESDSRAGEWRDLKDNHRLDPSDYFRLTSSGGSSVFHHPRAKWSGGGETVEFGRWSGENSALWIIVLITLSTIIVFGSVCRDGKRISATGEGGRRGVLRGPNPILS